MTTLSQKRAAAPIELPDQLKNFTENTPTSLQKIIWDPTLSSLFPSICHFFDSKLAKKRSLQNIGVVFSGGPAPGGHNVIAGLFDGMQQLFPQAKIRGFLNGLDGLIKNNSIEITADVISSYRNQGGFDLLGSGRTKIETEEQLQTVAQTLQSFPLDGLVIIGGDDSNTSAAFMAEYFLQNSISTQIIGIPKTIDADLKNQEIEISFGFDTATKIYAEIIGNLAKDALSSKKYYFFVKMMGRSASHVTLECALKTQINMALISEEIGSSNWTLVEVVYHIADLICERAKIGKNYGVILIPEGLLEFIADCKILMQELSSLSSSDFHLSALSERAATCWQQLTTDIQQQIIKDKDAYGNVQVSLIDTEKLLLFLVEKELACRKKTGQYTGVFAPQSFFCGYEGRCGLPSYFDCTYCYALGYGAIHLLVQGLTGVMCCIQNLKQPVQKWIVKDVPFFSLMKWEMRQGKKKAVIAKALVDTKSKLFAYFIENRKKWRLEDNYLCPGPIQWEGDKEIVQSIPYSLRYE